MFDILTNKLSSPLIMFFNASLTEHYLQSEMYFVSAGLKEGKEFDLLDKREHKWCRITIPSAIANLPRDVAFHGKSQIKIVQWY